MKRKEYLTYVSRLIEITIETQQEPYLCEVLMPFLRSCCYNIGVKPVAVFDDRGFKSKTNPEKTTSSIARLRKLLCSDDYKGKYSVPDYVFVDKNYCFDSDCKAVLLVETKVPKIEKKNSTYTYKGVKVYLDNQRTKEQIRAEICELRNPILFSDGITWKLLSLGKDKKSIEEIWTWELIKQDSNFAIEKIDDNNEAWIQLKESINLFLKSRKMKGNGK